MSESTPDTRTESDEPGRSDVPGRIDDEQLPEDLQPTDDNPLAKPLDEDDDGDSGLSLGPDGPQAMG
jgi:hypothetical protein